MKILAISDVELDLLHNRSITRRFKDVDLIISCGDLADDYLEYVVSMLDRRLYYVQGNHVFQYGGSDPHRHSYRDPAGGINLHNRVVRAANGLLMAGIEGSVRYNRAAYQYTQQEMWGFVFQLIPRLLLNRILYGRFLDIFVSHAPPWKIHDKDDLPHQGARAFRWLLETFHPTIHLHGHIHIDQQYEVTETVHHRTRVINVYGYKVIEWDTQRGAGKSPTPVD
jgi:Icc-related predicted phosphoesterase